MLKKYRRVVAFALRQSRLLFAIVVLTLGYSALSALQPWPLKLLVDHALGEAPLPGWAMVLGGRGAADLLYRFGVLDDKA